MSKIGATYASNGTCSFTVWAPDVSRMILHLVHPREQKLEMQKDQSGYFCIELKDLKSGCRYFFRPEDEKSIPDPASCYQPEGVHGPSEVIDHSAFRWQDEGWHGIPFKELIFYELHVGTFTKEGTFEAIIPRLDDLVDTGITALELMPISQFPGQRNWGYDGVYPYSVQNSYGGPEGLKKLVDACHQKNIAVFLDVVYNHLGPEGNYFQSYAPYFTDKYHTPWGEAINFDGEWADGVRRYFSDNPLYWFENYHIDGLRLDAIHAIYDSSAISIWELMDQKIRTLEQKLGRSLYLVAESDLNSPRVIKSPEAGGYGFTAQWLDDFHHALYVLLDKAGKDRYADFGRIEQLAKAYTDGFVHSGEYVSFRKRTFGASSAGIPGDKFVIFNQNHDQVGNRVRGERLSMLVDFDRLKLAAAAILLAPYLPMLFMGEEYGEDTPFFYFVSHSDPDLIKAVRKGRKQEFKGFKWKVNPPDPQDEATFEDSRLSWQKRDKGKHRKLLQWHKKLIELRRSKAILQNFNKNNVRAQVHGEETLMLGRQSEDGQQHILCLFNFSENDLQYSLPSWSSSWTKLLDSNEAQWLEEGEKEAGTAPQIIKSSKPIILKGKSVVVYESPETDEMGV